jgi:hypothetical protein
MVGVEGSLRDSFNLYKENPKFVLPHLVEGILDVAIIISMVITVLLAIGVHVTEVILDDPEALASQISAGGMGLIVILIITFLFAILLITVIKAAAFAGVVGMSKKGFNDGSVGFGQAVSDAKAYGLDVFIFWIIAFSVWSLLVLAAFIPSILLGLAGSSETVLVAITLLAFLLTFILSIVFYIAIMFTPMFIVGTDNGVIKSMRLSLEYVRANLGSVLIYVAVVIVFNFFLFSFFGIVSLLPSIFGGGSFLRVFLDIFFNLLTFVVGILFAPYFEMVKTRMIMDAGPEGSIESS